MELDKLGLVAKAGVSASEKREPSEWLDLKSRVEEEKFRKLSADLERRRTRRFLHHAEEERKVVKELDNLQRDRLRFEREKQLRQRNSFSISRERRHSTTGKTPLSEANTQLPMNQKSFGGSASLAFDPTDEKNSRPLRRVSRDQTLTYGSVSRKASKDLGASNGFPYIEEEDVQRFHKSCKSAAKGECRRWGAAWFYAKKEQDVAVDSKKRWTALLLKFEKEKMRILSEKGVALMDSGLDRNTHSGDSATPSGIRKNAQIKRAEISVDEQNHLPPCSNADQTRNDSKDNVELKENEKLTFHKAFSLPQAISSKEGDIFVDKVSENTSRLSSMDCRNISASLVKERAQGRELKRSRKSRTISPEEKNETSKETLAHRMPAISEVETEESSSTSSENSAKTRPRRKRAVLFLPSLTKEVTKG